MAYYSIADLAKKFWTSERTIYTYLKKFENEIRIKEDRWTKLIHFNDLFGRTSKRLQKFYRVSNWSTQKVSDTILWSNEVLREELPKNFNDKQIASQNFRSSSIEWINNPYLKTVKAIEAKYEKLQWSLEAVQSQNQQLEKARNNFENKAKEYAMMFKEEQSEKKIWEGKFLTLQEVHTSFRIKLERIVTGLIVVLFLLLAVFALLYLIGAISVDFA